MLQSDKSYRGELPPLTGEETASTDRMRTDVVMLAETIGERNTSKPAALRHAKAYIADRFRGIGYQVQEEEYLADDMAVANLIAELPGTVKRDEIVVVGAHYDSAPGTTGANDNASGVAAMLELALMFKDSKPERTTRFVAFVNEEQPYYWTELMGSRVHAFGARQRKENIVAMLCLECLGVYSDEPGSQQYPSLLAHQYPDTANFIVFCSDNTSYPLLMVCVQAFRATTPFPSEWLAAPESVAGVDCSDHWSFWQEGYKAIMITDTAFFRYSHYHKPTDTPEKLDYQRMAQVVGGIGNVIKIVAQL